MVSTLVFQSGGRWFEPGLCRCVVSLNKKLNSTLSFFTQVYKWVLAIIILVGNLAMDYSCSIPSRRSSNIPSRFMLQEPELSAGLMGHLACKQT